MVKSIFISLTVLIGVFALHVFAAPQQRLALAQAPEPVSAPAIGPATLWPAARYGGAAGRGDARDADVYPAAAYSSTTGRYLVVWMSVRNAAGSTSNFDVYGVFLDQAGQLLSSEFKISDSNSAARGSLPVVATNGDEFVVAWAARASLCQVYVQRVTDSLVKSDRLLVALSAHAHSPSLAYNATRGRYSLAYVNGDDYQAPTLFGAATNTCGSNSASLSKVNALEFSFTGDVPVVTSPVIVSDGAGGAFRPRHAYSAGLNQYAVVWEDRRNAGTQPLRFDVFAQRLNSDLSKSEPNIQLDTGYDYTNLDTSSTWTPRPVVAGGPNQFMVAWFRHQQANELSSWSLVGKTIATSGTPGTAFSAAEMSFAAAHSGQAPTGFAVIAYLDFAQEYIVGFSSHLESFAGYFSTALVQRLDVNGGLVGMNGSVQSAIGVGRAVDYDLDDQIGIGMAVNASDGAKDIVLAYSKHAPQRQSQDLDVWGARMQYLTLSKKTYLTVMHR